MAANVAVAQDPAGNLKPAYDSSTERRNGTGPRARCCTPDCKLGEVRYGWREGQGQGVVEGEAAGKVTGDRRTEAEGKTDRAKGEAKDAAHHAKEGAKGVRDSLKKD